MMQKTLWIFIGMSGFIAVLMGAAAVHWLATTMDQADIVRVEKAATYQMYHTLVLLALAACGLTEKCRMKWPVIIFALGIILFSGSLYAYSFTHIKALVYITPMGGVAFMLGWLLLARVGFVKKDEKP